MSWAEIKKAVNSDLNVPLNHLLWINDICIFGEDGYVLKNETLVNDLLKGTLVHNSVMAISEILKLYPQKITLFDLNNDSLIDNILRIEKTVNAVYSNSMAANVFLSNNNVKSKIAKNNKYVNQLLEYDNLIDILKSDSYFIKELLNSDFSDKLTKYSSYNKDCLVLGVKPESSDNVNSYISVLAYGIPLSEGFYKINDKKNGVFIDLGNVSKFNDTIYSVFHRAPIKFTNIRSSNNRFIYIYKL
jgi:hypothetical protein